MTEVERVGRALARARASVETQWAALGAVVRSAAEQGVPEAELARQAGVDRMTIRRLRGKGRQ